MNKYNIIFYFNDGTRLSYFIKNDKMDGVGTKVYDSNKKASFGNREIVEINVKCVKGVI